MISEIDIRDWKDSSGEAYGKFVEAKGGEQAYGSEIWEAACIWAFDFLKEGKQ